MSVRMRVIINSQNDRIGELRTAADVRRDLWTNSRSKLTRNTRFMALIATRMGGRTLSSPLHPPGRFVE